MSNIYFVITKKLNTCMVTRHKTSKIWTLPENEFKKIIIESKRMRDVMNFFNFKHNGNNYNRIKERIDFLKLDISHYLNKQDSSLLSRINTKEDVIKKYLIKDFQGNNSHTKKYIIKFNIIPYKCRECLLESIWNNRPISLQLEHINGDSTDNRIENLCFLCPNCHSQTDTYAGKNRSRTR